MKYSFPLLSPLAAAAFGDAEEHSAADPGEQPKAVYEVPHGGDDGKRRRAVRPLILPDHRHVRYPVYGTYHRAAEGGAKVPEIYGPDFRVQKIHDDPP